MSESSLASRFVDFWRRPLSAKQGPMMEVGGTALLLAVAGLVWWRWGVAWICVVAGSVLTVWGLGMMLLSLIAFDPEARSARHRGEADGRQRRRTATWWVVLGFLRLVPGVLMLLTGVALLAG